MTTLEIVWQNLPRLLDGTMMTIQITALSVIFGLCLAVPLAMMRVSKNPLLWMPVYGFIFYFRGTPLLVQIFLIYYGSGQFQDLLSRIGLWIFFREAYFCAVLTLALNTAAYTAEILRGAIKAVPFGEVEAARAMGMSRLLLYRRIILPVAFRLAWPGELLSPASTHGEFVDERNNLYSSCIYVSTFAKQGSLSILPVPL